MDMTNAGVNTFAVGSAIFDERPIKKDKIWNLPNRTKEAFLDGKENKLR